MLGWSNPEPPNRSKALKVSTRTRQVTHVHKRGGRSKDFLSGSINRTAASDSFLAVSINRTSSGCPAAIHPVNTPESTAIADTDII